MKLDRDSAKQYVKEQLPSYLSSKGINTRKVFKCLNPSHRDSTPSMKMYKAADGFPHCKCQGCGVHYDTFDILALDFGLSDDKDVFEKAYSYFGIEIESGYAGSSPAEPKKPQNQNQPKNEQEAADLTPYFLKAHENISQTDYLQKRGLSDDIIKRFKLGYEPNFKQGTGGKVWQAIIIPTTKYTYTARNTAADADKTNKIRKVGASGIFNAAALNSNKPIFLVEGELDAISVIDAGGEAVALGSTSNFHKFVSLIKSKAIKTPMIMLALDNDDAGRECTANILQELKGFDKCRIEHQPDIYGQYKDANEMLAADRGALVAAVQSLNSILNQEQKQLEEEYKSSNVKNYLGGFIAEMQKPENTVYYPTGFASLDSLLDGGLYNGLYCLGAISSLGKTTFCLQIADQIAQQGHDVLIFSLEMAKYEIMAKTLSRCTYIESVKNHGSTRHAKTTRGLIAGSRYDSYSIDDMRIIHAAMENYGQFAEHIYIHEGMGDIGVKDIRDMVDKHKTLTGKSPIVIIDYIQILAPYTEGATDKQNTDKAVLELKRLSRDYAIPVIGISSFNRDNYTAPVNMASFKESGAVEYSSDVLLALQYEGMDWQEGESEKDRNARVRTLMNDVTAKGKRGEAQQIQVKVLKNRNGSKGDCCIDFIPMFNYFHDKTEGNITVGTPTQDGFMPILSGETPFDSQERKVNYGKAL